MREIKFRAWSIKQKKMMRYVDEIIWSSDEPGKLLSPSDCILMQYTGLKDKNGKEVYEGDIVKGEDDICLIQWQDESMAFVFAKNGWMFNHFIEEMGRDMKNFEIIGNIYENPELLP